MKPLCSLRSKPVFAVLALVTLWGLMLGCGKKEETTTQQAPPAVETRAVTNATPLPTPPPESSQRKAAIFVANHAIKELNDKIATLEDFISSRITEKGFSVISREVATDALSGLLKDSKQTDADQLLSNNSSALRLAQMLGANYLIYASISSFGTDRKAAEVYGVKVVNVTHNLRVAYKILDGNTGGSLAGDTLKVSKTFKLTEGAQEDAGDFVNELLDQASVKVVESAGKKEIKFVSATKAQAEFTVVCGMQDLAQVPMTIPDVRVSNDGSVVLRKDKIEIQALDVTVELDGVVIGSTPATFKAAPGLHKIRLSHEGFNVWERTINIVEGQKLKVSLQMSEAGYERWKNNTTFLQSFWQENAKFLQSLDNEKKLTDAEVKLLEGQAQMLRQSGYKVDLQIRADSKDRSFWSKF